MGVYDTVIADCPNCGKEDEFQFQTKSGPCVLGEFKLGRDLIPYDVILNVNRHAPQECSQCGKSYSVAFEKSTYAQNVRLVERELSKDAK